ncbi:LruC domain-containing protein [Mucilaginibacter limnophilus]|uniref:LruC domain-containing protein n=1 Tax=Mucilaginibacter limnophilus TaxID=1932778 RepID=A0A3S2UN31_9SPHI|nr:LruC domain-containing protein [Mucilaginibacter limnophilus]RVU01763.1 LruC domain-containing protein [Mucilaginibacter limnophilus]
MKKLFTTLFITTAIFAASCKKDSTPGQETAPEVEGNKLAPEGFNFATTKDVNVNITLRTNTNEAIAGVVVNVYNPSNPDAAIFKAVTDKSGNIKGKITVPSSLTQLVIDPAYVGLIRNVNAEIKGNATSIVIGGADGVSGDFINVVPNTLKTNSLTTNASSLTTISYPSPYRNTSEAVLNTSSYPLSLGRPKYLEATGDAISAELLRNVNASLPESSPLPQTHPEYLKSTVTSTLNIVEQSDVWITYVSEGAGNLNTLAFYTYTTGNPPARERDIRNATYIFPNASGVGSGGGLKAGDKVKLGRFPKGTTIAFMLIGNSWNGSGVNTGNTTYYSDDNLNPEGTASLRKHSVVLHDSANDLFLIGFEDLPRDGSSDNDFNDLVFYATSNPVTGISDDGVPPVDTGKDKDGDGVDDDKDAFPDDATKAYISYYPSENTYAQVAFEDNWPNKGDYDLNDLVVNCRYKFISNAKNQVISLTGDFVPVASGASFKNGFGLQLPVAASQVASVTGQNITGSYISRASNGVESGQAKAVIIPFDDQDNVLKYPDLSFFVNTMMDKNKVVGTTVSVEVKFTAAIDPANLQASAFNPFLISNKRRGYEVHLPGFAPTDKADAKLFDTSDDASKPSTGKYYLSNENWPWAISYNTSILYPIETAPINNAYLHFAEWARSAGTSYTDWYSNTAAGYRNTSLLYTK